MYAWYVVRIVNIRTQLQLSHGNGSMHDLAHGIFLDFVDNKQRYNCGQYVSNHSHMCVCVCI